MSSTSDPSYSELGEEWKRQLDQIPWLKPPEVKRWRDFAASWFDSNARVERVRVIAKSKRFADAQALDLYQSLATSLLREPSGVLPKTTFGPRQIAGRLLKIAVSKSAAKSLRALASLIEAFPFSESIDLDPFSAPERFKPTLQDGLKAVMLGAFFKLNTPGRHPGENLPTIGELDYAIRHKWKWTGGDKELRDARRELGLSGLPRARSGRPKQRGKK